MPISSDPPSGRKYRSSSRGSSASMSARIPLMNHAKARQRQIVVDDLDRNGPFGEQCGQPAGADDLHRSPVFRLDARHQPLDHGDVAPEDSGVHGGAGVLADNPHRVVVAGPPDRKSTRLNSSP